MNDIGGVLGEKIMELGGGKGLDLLVRGETIKPTPKKSLTTSYTFSRSIPSPQKLVLKSGLDALKMHETWAGRNARALNNFMSHGGGVVKDAKYTASWDLGIIITLPNHVGHEDG